MRLSGQLSKIKMSLGLCKFYGEIIWKHMVSLLPFCGSVEAKFYEKTLKIYEVFETGMPRKEPV